MCRYSIRWQHRMRQTSCCTTFYPASTIVPRELRDNLYIYRSVAISPHLVRRKFVGAAVQPRGCRLHHKSAPYFRRQLSVLSQHSVERPEPAEPAQPTEPDAHQRAGRHQLRQLHGHGRRRGQGHARRRGQDRCGGGGRGRVKGQVLMHLEAAENGRERCEWQG